jgi:hypothetical protein
MNFSLVDDSTCDQGLFTSEDNDWFELQYDMYSINSCSLMEFCIL